MQDFIKHHMMVILQPVINQVEALHGGFEALTDSLSKTDKDLGDIMNDQKALKANLFDLKDDVIERTNGRIRKLNDAMDRFVANHECLHSMHEDTKGQVRSLHEQLGTVSGAQPGLQRTLQQLGEELQAVRAAGDRTAGELEMYINHPIVQMCSDLQELKKADGRKESDITTLQADLAKKGQALQETKEALDKNVGVTSSLMQEFQDMVEREAQMGARVEGWRHQLNPAIDRLRKDASVMQQQLDHYHTVMEGLQQGYATTFSSLEAVEDKHHKLAGFCDGLKENLAGTQSGKATSFSNNLHTVLERTMGDLSRTSKKLEGIESRHDMLSEHLVKTTGDLADLVRDHKSSSDSIQVLAQDLRRTNDSLSPTKGQLEATATGLQGMRTELGRTNDAVQRLDHGVELCHAGFSGLQKGIQETGNHMLNRPTTLPKLPQDRLRSPRGRAEGTSSMATTAASWRGAPA